MLKKILGAAAAITLVVSVATANLATEVRAAGPASVADLAERLLGAVVNISTAQTSGTAKPSERSPRPQVPEGSPFQDFFDEFFKNDGDQENRPTPRSRRVQSLGSGFVIDPSGIIITNNHVIADADEITIDFADGSKLKAEVIGTDPKTDIAVLKVNPEKPLQSVSFGDSKASRIGDWVMAIGNPFGQGSSVSLGIISAINRDIRSGPYDNFIQTDAAINRGNSGGPLFNMDGDVIGINTAIISPTGGSIGLGFSIPSSLAVGVIDQLQEFGETRRGWLGVSIQPVTEDIAESLKLASTEGALVAGITPKSPAQASGLRVGDIILTFDGTNVVKMRDLPRIVADTPAGKTVKVVVMRRGKQEELDVTIGRLKDGEKIIAETQKSESEKKEEVASTYQALGITFAELDEGARTANKIGEDIKGVLIGAVEPGSEAAEKGIEVGNVLAEIGQNAVNSPADVRKQLEKLESDGRKKALLLVSSPDGQLRFIVLSMQ